MEDMGTNGPMVPGEGVMSSFTFRGALLLFPVTASTIRTSERIKFFSILLQILAAKASIFGFVTCNFQYHTLVHSEVHTYLLMQVSGTYISLGPSNTTGFSMTDYSHPSLWMWELSCTLQHHINKDFNVIIIADFLDYS